MMAHHLRQPIAFVSAIDPGRDSRFSIGDGGADAAPPTIKLLKVTAAIVFLKSKENLRINFTLWRPAGSLLSLALGGDDPHTAIGSVGHTVRGKD